MTPIRLYHYQELANSLFLIRIEAGLPNITGSARLYKAEWYNADGALFMHGEINSGNTAAENRAARGTLKLDASHSSSIYGSSETVTPLSRSTLMLIKY